MVEIATMTPDDLDAAGDVVASGEVFQWYGLDRDTARRVLTETHGQVVVARREGMVVGVAVFWVDGPMPIPAYLRILAVNEGYRGQGIGRLLLRYVEEQAFRRGPNLFLCCTATNRRARQFYEREGYQAVGDVPNLIQAGLDEVLYRKSLGPIRGYAAPQPSP